MGMLREQLEQATAEEYGAWKSFFEEQAALPYFDRLDQYVSRRAAVGTDYPPPDKILNAFRLPPPRAVRLLHLRPPPTRPSPAGPAPPRRPAAPGGGGAGAGSGAGPLP